MKINDINTRFDAKGPTGFPEEKPPKTWLAESIIVTILCCLPFGIVGIVYAAKVESRWYAGMQEESLYYSGQARKWTMAGLIGGIVVGFGYMILLFTGVIGGIAAGGGH